MTQSVIGTSRLAQRASGSAVNANFTELYGRQVDIQLNGVSAAGSFVVPAGYIIEHIAIINNTANAITGGLKIGKTSGAADIVAAQAVAASSLNTVTGANVLIRLFSKTVDQTVYFDAVTAWNSANIDLHLTLRKMW